MFSETLTEENDFELREKALQELHNNEFDTNPKHFYESMSKSKYVDFLTPYSPSELSQMKLFKLKSFNIGYALKKHDGKYSEIVAVHNNESQIKGIGKELIKSAIKHGGCYLDCFDGFLPNFYKSLGFIEVSRDKFNPDFDEEGKFEKKYGKQDIVYMVHKSCLLQTSPPQKKETPEEKSKEKYTSPLSNHISK